MKYSIFFMLLGILSVSAESYAQRTKLSIDVQNGTLYDVVTEIEKQTGFMFFYKSGDIDKDLKVNVHAKDMTVTDILTDIMRNTDLTYVVDNKHILIAKKSNLAFQQITVTGTVTDDTGEPVPGVNVVIKGTVTGGITDVNGKYSIPVPNKETVLVFSFIGYSTKEFVVGSQTTINVVLDEETKQIEEVVVVGYGTIRRHAVTGSVANANLNTYKQVPSNNILDNLKGTIAGLNVSGVNRAGGVPSISIRGQNSIAASTNPLVVVDGAIFNGSLADIATDDIESFTVLKDMSAAAVYGARSANGVIIIDTKRGKGVGGKPVFNFRISYGMSSEMQKVKVFSPNEYIQRIIDGRKANGQETDIDNIALYMTAEEQKNYNATPDHTPTLPDPFDPILQSASETNVNFSISNRTEKSSYYISTNLIKQNGLIINDQYKQVAGRINLESDLTDWLNIGVKSLYSLRDNSGSLPGYQAVNFSPWASLYNDDGTYMQFPQTTTSFPSPLWDVATSDVKRYNHLNGILSVNLKCPWVEGLTYTLNFSNSLRWDETSNFYNEYTHVGISAKGQGQRAYSKGYNMMLDNLLKYNRTFNKHHVDLTLVYSRESGSSWAMTANGKDFDNTALGDYRLQNGKTQTVSSSGGDTFATGLMGRATYTYDEKYSVTGTIRRDTYSAFSKNKKVGVFPSVGVNWRVSGESFMQNVEAINNLALRASYGSNGNRTIDPYSTLAKMANGYYYYNGDASYTVTEYVSTLANNDLGWESTTGLNLGVDFSLLKHRITGSVDYYATHTNDLMFSLPLPTISGKSSITSNIGEIANRGIDVSLATVNVSRNDFEWRSNIVFSLNRNRVVTIYGEDKDGDGKEDDLISAGYFIGKSLGTIYDYKVIGMWQEADVANGTIMSGMYPGTHKIEDVDGNGKIESGSDRQFLGNRKENFRWSFTNTFRYKDLQLMVYLYSIWGGNGYYLSTSNTPQTGGYAYATSLNYQKFDYWTPDNPDAFFPGFNYSKGAYKGYKPIERSFVKLQKISLTYDFTRLVKPYKIQGLSATVSADNLLCWAPKWKGLDPELDAGLSGVAGMIPSIRTIMFSLSFNF